MSEDTKLTELIINTLSPEQLPEVLSETELYLVEDDVEYASVDELSQGLATKQDVITDLDAIRTNANLVNTKQDICIHIVSTYDNGTSGYRIWSDGYCEQWGRTSKRGGNATYTVSLLKHYKDTNYNIVATPDSGGSYTNNEAQVITNITDSSFNIWNWGNTKDHWKTSGYLAEGEY